MAQETVFIKFEHCYKCGILFGLPLDYQIQRVGDGRRFWCPNGHGQAYLKPKSEEQKRLKSLEERQELALAMHRAEQAKAAEAEAKLGAKKPAMAESSSPAADAAGESTDTREVITVRETGGYANCPKCGKRYRPEGIALRAHLRCVHSIDLKNTRLDIVPSAASPANEDKGNLRMIFNGRFHRYSECGKRFSKLTRWADRHMREIHGFAAQHPVPIEREVE